MSQVLASSKSGSNKYDLKSNDPNKVLPRLDVRQIAQSFQTLYEMAQGWSYSGDEGSPDAIVNNLSIIDVSNINTYSNDLPQAIQTLVANASRLESDAGSTANAIILNPPVISPGASPDSNDYSQATSLPFQYREGLRFTFRATTTNTGALTINVPLLAGLGGAVDTVDFEGINLVGGEVVANNYYTIICQEFAAIKKFILVASGSSETGSNNLAINGQGLIGQRGLNFTAATTPANDNDTYLLDRQLYLASGADGADVSQETTFVPEGAPSAIKYLQATANIQTSYCQIFEGDDAAAIIGGTASLSFSAAKGGSNTTLGTLRAALVAWDGTKDVVTSDVVASWNGAGTDPTLAANWTYENTPEDLALTDSYQTFKIKGVPIDTPSATNVALHVWVDDTDATVSDEWYIGDIQVKKGSASPDFSARLESQELSLCQRFAYVAGGESVFNQLGSYGTAISSTVINSSIVLPTTMRTVPSLAIIGNWQISDGVGALAATSIAISSGSSTRSLVAMTGIVASGLTTFRPYRIESANSTASLAILDSEL